LFSASNRLDSFGLPFVLPTRSLPLTASKALTATLTPLFDYHYHIYLHISVKRLTRRIWHHRFFFILILRLPINTNY
jgi:hypothetical protein